MNNVTIAYEQLEGYRHIIRSNLKHRGGGGNLVKKEQNEWSVHSANLKDENTSRTSPTKLFCQYETWLVTMNPK